ncbi:hypothetical protein ACFLV0_03565 [Chloroflexota bacterium]
MSELKKGKVLLLNSEGCGTADPDLGYEILMGMMKVLSERDDWPVAIICWNTAVEMLAGGSPVLPYLKTMAEKGTQILAGQLCVSQLGLTDKLAIGKTAPMEDILDLFMHNDVISL